MCGIFAYIGENNSAGEVVLNGLKELEYRGYDSWGIAIKNDEKLWLKKGIGKIGNVTSNGFPKGEISFGHTRWATHGGVTKKNAHPHFSCDKSFGLIHNGIVENYEELKNGLSNKHAFESDTDTEVLVHLIEEENNNSFTQAVIDAFKKTKGLSAIIVFHKEANELIAIRKGSPLVIGYGQNHNLIASDPSALISHTKNVYFLEDNQYAVVSKNKVSIHNLISQKKITEKKSKISWSNNQASRGNYKHFMLKEIFEQPNVIEKIIENKSYIKEMAQKIKKLQTTLIGCGTASHACIAGKYLFSTLSKKKVDWVIGSEFSYHTNFLSEKNLVVALSQSGETMDILQAVKSAKKKESIIGSLVNVVGSTLYRESDISLPLFAGPEKAVASTKAFIAKLTYLYLIAEEIGGKKNSLDLSKAKEAVKSTLSRKSINKIKKISKKIYKNNHLFVVGRGVSYPISLETALKIKEISYIHSEGLAAGELKHGVIALIEKGTPCVVYIPNDQAVGENLAAAMELKARGAYIIGVSPDRKKVFDYHIPIKDVGTASIFPNTVVGQLLAYYLAVERRLDPDMPRNLAKSVTVK
ncbi:glutamine--fructose-6-phosphate transaminase (isomerizing) [Patescibacteria group bacterium]